MAAVTSTVMVTLLPGASSTRFVRPDVVQPLAVMRSAAAGWLGERDRADRGEDQQECGETGSKARRNTGRGRHVMKP